MLYVNISIFIQLLALFKTQKYNKYFLTNKVPSILFKKDLKTKNFN